MFPTRSRLLAIALAAGLLAAALPAGAGGFGLALEGEWTFSDGLSDAIPFNAGRVDRDFEQATWGIGFSYDTNIARDEVWNYRFKIGYRNGDRDFDDTRTVRLPRRTDAEDTDEVTLNWEQDEESIHAVTIHQTVGYGFIRNEEMRAWAGPSIRLNVDFHNPVTNLDVVNVAIGAGPEVGVNAHVTERLSVSMSLAYNYMYLTETLEVTGEDRRFDGGQHMAALMFTLFWRTDDDVFEPAE